jgi:hypothetical protein
MQQYHSRGHIFIEVESHVVSKLYALKHRAVMCTKPKVARIQYVISFNVPLEYSYVSFFQIICPLWIGGLLVAANEGIVSLYLSLAVVSLLLSSKTMEMRTPYAVVKHAF